MKTSIYLILAFSLFTNYSIAQNKLLDKYLNIKLSDVKSKNSEIQKYDVILKIQKLDAINGSKIDCNVVTATYTCGLDSGYVKWNNVGSCKIDNFLDNCDEEVKIIGDLENFTYKLISTDFLKQDTYKNISTEYVDIATFLASDAAQMQGLAWYISDSLKFNKEFYPELLNDIELKFENSITLINNYQKLKWIGVSKYNNEICAIIKFESLYNPFEKNAEQINIKGRSLYWGEIWVSLEDKQVEYSYMIEDLVMKFTDSMFPKEKLIELQREIVFNKKK